MRHSFVLLLLILISNLTIGSVIVQCENMEYAGQKLDFFRPADPITDEQVFAFSLEFNLQGKATATIESKTSNYIFCDFGIYRGMLIIEPNEIVKLNLPPFRKKSFADEKNPYFTPVSFWFTSDDKTQINNLQSTLTIQLNQLTDKYFNQLYFRQSHEMYDSVLFLLDQHFDKNTSDLFQFYKRMKLQLIKADIFRLKPENYSNIFNEINSELWLQQAFIELFGKTFSGLLSFEVKTVKGDELRAAVNNSNIAFLLNLLKTKYNITGDMAELALLKMLHDAHYSGDFSKNAIQKMVDEPQFTKNKNAMIRVSAKNISSKFSFLKQGNIAPVICLQNLNGEKTCTNTNKKKFKYLVFADVEMVICREQLKYLSTLQEKFNKYLEIFVILRKTNSDEIKKFFAENKIAGIKLLDEKNQFIDQYKIKTYPQCFLLDEKHQLKFTNAKSPMDGFEQQFGTFLQQELFERQRNQSR